MEVWSGVLILTVLGLLVGAVLGWVTFFRLVCPKEVYPLLYSDEKTFLKSSVVCHWNFETGTSFRSIR